MKKLGNCIANRSIVLVALLLNVFFSAFSQKRTLDQTSHLGWPIIQASTVKISGDGKYMSYQLETTKLTTIIQATDLSWKMEFDRVSEATFSKSSGKFFFQKNDTIGILQLTSRKVSYLTNVGHMLTSVNSNDILAYRLKDRPGTVVLQNFKTDRKLEVDSINQVQFNEDGKSLSGIVRKTMTGQSRAYMIHVDLGDFRILEQELKANPVSFVFDFTGTKLAYLAEFGNQGGRKLLYSKLGSQERVIVENNTPGMEGMELSAYGLSLSALGDKIFFNIEQPKRKEARDSKKPKIVIWSSEQELRSLKAERTGPFLAVFTDGTGKVVRLQQTNDSEGGKLNTAQNSGFILIQSKATLRDKPDSSFPDLYLVSTLSGSRQMLAKGLLNQQATFSPSGKFACWFDDRKTCWQTYEIGTGKIRNISKGIETSLARDHDQASPAIPRGLAGWLKNDEAVLIYDKFDIWKVDPKGIKGAINLTQGLGLKNQTGFALLQESPEALDQKQSIIIRSSDYRTKQNGFYRLALSDKQTRLTKLSSGNWNIYYDMQWSAMVPGSADALKPVKAQSANAYIITKMSATEYPNLYLTQDFRSFSPLTQLAPQKQFNWYSNELCTWNLPDGQPGSGMLYKPEDFDANKKYPVIFYYYEKNSDALNNFIHPLLSRADLDIPYFASRGYLVFVPDIHYRIGSPGESALNTVESAAIYLGQFPWVNTNKMGLQGHSFGGYETNYILTHSTRFAAAVSASGPSDLISGYNSPLGNVSPLHDFYEKGQIRMGKTLWEAPESYIKNSPVFSVDKVNAPLFLMHSKRDGIVDYNQGMELFMAMKRLKKKAWLISYEGESHNLGYEENQLDYMLRMEQFFDHYLKDKPAPKWMTSNDTGLELDHPNVQP